jgi:RNA recognition motif-containing protein
VQSAYEPRVTHNSPKCRPAVTEDALRAHLASAGTLSSVSILTTSSGKSRGCATAVFADSAAADRAIQTLTDTELDGRKIFIREDREAGGGAPRSAVKAPRGEITVVKTSAQHAVSVRNLPRDITSAELKGIFQSCGATGASVAKKGGSGRVEFKSAGQAARAATDFNNALVNGQAISVAVL